MKKHLQTWKTIAKSWAGMWRYFAEQAKSDPKLAELMDKAANSLEAIEKYLEAKERG